MIFSPSYSFMGIKAITFQARVHKTCAGDLFDDAPTGMYKVYFYYCFFLATQHVFQSTQSPVTASHVSLMNLTLCCPDLYVWAVYCSNVRTGEWWYKTGHLSMMSLTVLWFSTFADIQLVQVLSNFSSSILKSVEADPELWGRWLLKDGLKES